VTGYQERPVDNQSHDDSISQVGMRRVEKEKDSRVEEKVGGFVYAKPVVAIARDPTWQTTFLSFRHQTEAQWKQEGGSSRNGVVQKEGMAAHPRGCLHILGERSTNNGKGMEYVIF